LDQQEIFIDSVAEIWNIEQLGEPEIGFNENIIREEPDSVYISRLSKISTLMSLSYNEKVRGWIQMYLNKNRRIPYLIGLSDYYFPFFEEVLEANQMPIELKYLPIIESALNPQAVSRGARATGLWQFIYTTGLGQGLQIDNYVDDRRDPLKSTIAAAKFLTILYDEFQDWTLALAAYNCGQGNVRKAIRRAGGKTDYWEIYPYLPRETRGYVPAFIAAVYVMNYYKEHNIVPIKAEFDINTDTIMVGQRLHFMQVSENLNIPVEQLRHLNPQYKRDIIPGTKEKMYALRLPAKTALDFVSMEKTIYGYKDSVFFNSNFAITQVHNSRKSKFNSYEREGFSPPSEKGKRKLSYTVKEGDNYGFIASWYNVNISDIKYWNGSYSNRLTAGQKLTVYVPIKKYTHYEQINGMTFDQKQATKGKVASSNNTQTVSTETNKIKDSNYVWYQIQGGDNLWIIAQKYPGITDQDIKRINGFSTTETKKLQAGQYIKIKRK
jgi:membrane-bound lytic murein transglycosylase D